MNLKWVKNVRKTQLKEDRIHAIAYAPNSTKLAACSDERVLYLYDVLQDYELKDKFALKPANSKADRKAAFQVKALEFSPDSQKLAVGQTDEIIYVYNLGKNWGDKKSIINKIETTSAVTSLFWPNDSFLYYGLQEGKLRAHVMKDGKSSSIYAGKSMICAVAGTKYSFSTEEVIYTAHIDGTLVRLQADGGRSIKKIGTHTIAK